MKHKTKEKTYNYPDHVVFGIRMEKTFRENYMQFCKDKGYDASKRLRRFMELDIEEKVKF